MIQIKTLFLFQGNPQNNDLLFYPETVTQVVHTAFTYLLLTLIYFHLECKILVKIPDSLLDSALALRGKEGDIVRGKL